MATVLLVDDVELFLELERSFLESGRHEVVTAASGEEALERLEEVDPALVLLDLYMPGIDGDELYRCLRDSDRWRHHPVIMVTAAGKDEEVRKCLAAGCDDYITKPANRKELVEKVQRLLGKVKARTTDRIPAALRVQFKSDGRHLQTLGQGPVAKRHLGQKALPSEPGVERGMGICFVRPEPQSLKVLEGLVSQV